MQLGTGERESVQTYTQTAHVELVRAETFYTCAVTDMFDDRIVQSGFECLGTVIDQWRLFDSESSVMFYYQLDAFFRGKHAWSYADAFAIEWY